MTTRFCLQAQGTCSREQLAIIQASRVLGYEYHFAQKCPEGEIPIGDVPFCEAVFGEQPVIKDFYPRFLKHMMHRGHYISSNHGGFLSSGFVKSATEWKSESFETGVYDDGVYLPTSPMHVCGIVGFTNEWRLYVASGELIASGWYQGSSENTGLPEFEIKWPRRFSGAVDIGTLRDGRVALVEAHAPFACGWYGDDPVLYAKWQIEAWNNADYWKVNSDAR